MYTLPNAHLENLVETRNSSCYTSYLHVACDTAVFVLLYLRATRTAINMFVGLLVYQVHIAAEPWTSLDFLDLDFSLSYLFLDLDLQQFAAVLLYCLLGLFASCSARCYGYPGGELRWLRINTCVCFRTKHRPVISFKHQCASYRYAQRAARALLEHRSAIRFDTSIYCSAYLNTPSLLVFNIKFAGRWESPIYLHILHSWLVLLTNSPDC